MKDSKPRKGGRPQVEIDPLMVEKLAMLQCSTKEIASRCGCSVDTIDRRFADIIQKGKDLGRANLRQKQYELAMSGNVTMLIWLGKQYLDQKDKQEFATDEKQGFHITIKDYTDDKT